MRLVKIGLGVTALGLLGTIVFAILENGAESDYEAAAPGNQANLDSISSRGRRDAALADVSLLVMGVGVVGTVVAALPMFVHSAAEKPPEAATTAFVAPMIGHGTTGAAFSLRF